MPAPEALPHGPASELVAENGLARTRATQRARSAEAPEPRPGNALKAGLSNYTRSHKTEQRLARRAITPVLTERHNARDGGSASNSTSQDHELKRARSASHLV